MICRKCNCEIPDTSSYCPECGDLISNKNHVKCSNCKNIVFNGDRYCKICGYKLSNKNQSITLESINRFNFIRLKNYKTITSIITLVLSIIMFASMFLPLIPIFNKSVSNYEILDVIVRKEDIFYLDITSVFSLLFNDFSGNYSYICQTLGRTIGVATYLIFAIYYLTIALFTLTLIVHCSIGIFTKKYLPVNKKILGYVLSISLIFTFGASCTGVGNLLITILSFVLLIYNFLIELISKERIFNKRKIIYKLSLFVVLMTLVVFLGFGTFKTNNDLLHFNLENFKLYYSNILSTPILHSLFINSEVINYEDKLTLFSLMDLYTLLAVGSMVLASISLVECIMSLTFPYIKLPIKKTIIGFVCYVLSLLAGFYFTYYANIKLSSDLINIKNTAYGTLIIYIIAFAFVIVAKKGYYKDNNNAIN